MSRPSTGPSREDDIAKLRADVADLQRLTQRLREHRIRDHTDVTVQGAVTGDALAYGGPEALGKWQPQTPDAPAPATTVTAETTFGLAPSAGSSALYSKGDHTHGTPTDPGLASVPSACVTRSTDFGPISQAAEPTVGWQTVVWDNGVVTTGQAHWNGDAALLCRRRGIYHIFGGVFWSSPPGGSSGHFTAHVRIADFENIMDPHHYVGGTGPLVGPAMTFARDWPLVEDQSVALKVLYQYSPVGPDLSLKAGRGLTYLGMTWLGYA